MWKQNGSDEVAPPAGELTANWNRTVRFVIESRHALYQNLLSKSSNDNMRNVAKRNILEVREENERQFNKKKKKSNLYKLNDLIAIQLIQNGTCLKLRTKLYGPYRAITMKTNDRYVVENIGCHDTAHKTFTFTVQMKPV